MSIRVQRCLMVLICALACVAACALPQTAWAAEWAAEQKGQDAVPGAQAGSEAAVHEPQAPEVDAHGEDAVVGEADEPAAIPVEDAQGQQAAEQQVVESEAAEPRVAEQDEHVSEADGVQVMPKNKEVMADGAEAAKQEETAEPATQKPGDQAGEQKADVLSDGADTAGQGNDAESEGVVDQVVAAAASDAARAVAQDQKAQAQQSAPATAAAKQDEASAQADEASSSKTTQEDQETRQGWTRLWGENALGTMKEVVDVAFKSSDYAVVATRDGFWDALAASALAGSYKAPILLTAPKSLSSATADELARLKTKKVFIVGGERAIAARVAKQLANLGIEVERLSGATAPDTAVAIAQAIPNKGKTAIIATVDTYHDALSIAPYAYANRAPVFLTLAGGTSIGANAAEELKTGGYTRTIIVGGNAAVAPHVEDQSFAAGINSLVRLGGLNAYETSVEIAKWGLDNGMRANRMGVATGQGYWDALTGSALLGKNKSVIVLADDANFSSIVSFVNNHRKSISKGYVFGGSAAVSNFVMNIVVTGEIPAGEEIYKTLTGVDLQGHSLVGIDVSVWNGAIDWAKVKASGVGYAILRAGYGSDNPSQDDTRFLEYVRGARAAGIPLGLYLYSYADSAAGATSEAAHMLRLLKLANLSPADVPFGVYYDLEEPGLARVANRPLFEQMATIFCNAVKNAGYIPGVYSSLSWWDNYLVAPCFDQWRRWVAQWRVSRCGYAGNYIMWQCSSEGAVPGISGNVDMNLWYG